MSSSSADLARAVAALYSTFCRYGADDLACCDFPDTLPLNLHLRSTPLDRLSPSDLSRYAWKAMTTWGTVDNFKHFLPRLLEILARDGEVYDADTEVLLGKLAYGHWQSWPAAERAAVNDYLHALWRHLRHTYPYDLSADTFLCGLGLCVADVSPWLTDWEHDTSVASAMHLADFVSENVERALARKYFRPGPHNAFWQDAPAQAQQVWNWLASPDRLPELESAFFAHADQDPEGKISAAVESLTRLRAVLDVLSSP